jgi:pimeloyl-ACP methyl ester carboxylesterase
VWRPVAALPLCLVLLLLPTGAGAQAPFTLGSFTELRRGPDGGEIWRGVIPGATTKTMVYVPPGFLPERRYPVIYLLHGMPGSPWSYVNRLSLAALSDTLIAKRLAAPFIAVVPIARSTRGWTRTSEEYLVRRVVPWIDAHLPVEASPEARTLAGLSAGGNGAIDIGLRHPRLFGRLESWGASFAHAPRLVVRKEAELLRSLRVRFYVSSGPARRTGNVRFARELAGLRLPVRLELLKSARRQWERQLDEGLRWAEASA